MKDDHIPSREKSTKSSAESASDSTNFYVENYKIRREVKTVRNNNNKCNNGKAQRWTKRNISTILKRPKELVSAMKGNRSYKPGKSYSERKAKKSRNKRVHFEQRDRNQKEYRRIKKPKVKNRQNFINLSQDGVSQNKSEISIKIEKAGVK